MRKSHYLRRGGVVYISAEAEAAFKFISSRPVGNIYGLGAESVCLRNVLDDPAPKISMEALAGIALFVDIDRLLIAAMPSETVSELEFKKLIFEDRDPLTAEAALLPMLAEASIISDEFRLGIRIGGGWKRK